MLEAQVGSNHSTLVQLVKQCLHNAPDQRPSTDVLLTTLQRMRVEVEGEYGGSTLNLDIVVRVKQAKEMKIKERQIQELTRQQVQVIIRNCNVQGDSASTPIMQQRHASQIEQMTRELAGKTTELQVSTKYSHTVTDCNNDTSLCLHPG